MPRKKMRYPGNRRSPIKHKVKGYTRKDGTKVGGHTRGKGVKPKRKSRIVSQTTRYYDPYEEGKVTITISKVWDHIEGTAWDEMHGWGMIRDFYTEYSALRDWVDGQYEDYEATTKYVPDSHEKYLDRKTKKLHRELIKEYGKR